MSRHLDPVERSIRSVTPPRPDDTHRASRDDDGETCCGLDVDAVAAAGGTVLDEDDWHAVDCDYCREEMSCPGCGQRWGRGGREDHRRCHEI